MTKKRFIGFARVSSREQEREGFSLDVQESGLLREAERRGGEVVKLFRVAETATRRDERTTFREMLAYAKKHGDQIDGIIVYKLDRAARNLKDYMALEDMEEQGLALVVVTQPTENTPAGRMMRRTLANFAAFQTEQQSLDVREGQEDEDGRPRIRLLPLHEIHRPRTYSDTPAGILRRRASPGPVRQTSCRRRGCPRLVCQRPPCQDAR